MIELLALAGWLAAVAAFIAVLRAQLRLGRAEAERATLSERARLALAEADASVRRVREEAERARPFAAESALRDLVTLVDDLDRAVASGHGGDGVAIIQRRAVSMLRRHGAERFTAIDVDLDPTAHEAVATRHSDAPAGRVIEELAAGYRLHGRLLRPAQVVVSAGAAARRDPSAEARE